jgi:hypothetical protein
MPLNLQVSLEMAHSSHFTVSNLCFNPVIPDTENLAISAESTFGLIFVSAQRAVLAGLLDPPTACIMSEVYRLEATEQLIVGG